MKKKDEGAIHKLLALIMLTWVVICWGVLLQVLKAGYVNQYLEDSLMQANLAAILVDPYHYGSTGELVFEDIDKTVELFFSTLNKSLGDGANRERLGISGDVRIMDFRVYEVTADGVMEFLHHTNHAYERVEHESGTEVFAPDGTEIQSSSIYAKIAVPVRFLFGIEVNVIKEHCVDVVSEEGVYEKR